MRTRVRCTLVVLFVLSLTGVAVVSTLPTRAQVMQPPPPAATPEGDGPWVVRAYYSDRQMVNELAAWHAPWEVHHDQGYLVVDVTRAEYERLLAAGFTLEIDERLTAELNQPNVPLPGQVGGIPGYPCYRTVEETFATAQAIVAAHPNLATWTDVGDSWEKTEPGGVPGYDMMVLRLTNSAVPGPKPKLFVMTSVHAREYTPAELGTRFAEYLVDNYDQDPDVTWLLDYHEIHLMLQANPDGRKKAETGLSWRKNTNNNYCSDTNSRGADLNRNFEFYWHGCGNELCSSSDPCYNTYRGPGAASEPETQAIQIYTRAQFPDQREDDLGAAAPVTATGVFLDIHSYSELVLWPWGFTSTPAPNGAALQTLGRKFAYFNGYAPQQAESLYPTDGTTDDFAYGELGLPAYTFELGTTFFQNCATFENTILPDNLPALVYAAKVARTPYLTPAGPDALDVAVVSGGVAQLTATINDTRYNNSHGAEPTQNVAAAEFYIDVPPWVTTPTPVAYPMASVDGAFDETIEQVQATVDTTGLDVGRHIIFVRGRDAAGNWGAFSAAFLYLLEPGVMVEPATGALAGDPGSPVTYTLRITNTGSYTNSYWITITGNAWATIPVPGLLSDLGPNAGADVRVRVTITPTALAGAQDVTIVRVTDGVISDSSQLTTTADAVYGVLLTPETAALSNLAGRIVTYTLWATNTGNITDTYLVEAAGGWPVSVSPSLSFTLAAGQAQEVAVSVSVPATAASGAQDATTVTVHRFGDTQPADTSVLTTTVGCGIVSGVGFDLAPSELLVGEIATFTGTVTAGTLPITYIWDWGDGSSLEMGNPITHVFTAPQTYTVTLTVDNICARPAVAQRPVTVRPYPIFLPLVLK